jgi:hypothetical protein
MVEYLLMNPIMAGVAGGIVGAIVVFLTTLSGILKCSGAAKILESTIWKKYGYRVSGFGAIWGAVLGFVYGFVALWVFTIIYNALI